MSPSPERWPELQKVFGQCGAAKLKFTNQMLGSIEAPTAISNGEYDELIQREDTEHMFCAQFRTLGC